MDSITFIAVQARRHLEGGNALSVAAVRDGIPWRAAHCARSPVVRKVSRKRVERADWMGFLATAEENYASLLDQ